MPTVTLNQALNFSPATETEEILQNVRVIVATVRGTAMLRREFGVTGELVDRPLPEARQALTADIIAAVRRWEPRAEVIGVTYTADALDGRMGAAVEVRL